MTGECDVRKCVCCGEICRRFERWDIPLEINTVLQSGIDQR